MAESDSPSTYSALELEDVAELLGVSERMVRNYIKDNDLPCRGDGRGRRFAWPEVREWYVQYRISLSGSRGSLGVSMPEVGKESIDQAVLRRTVAEANLKELQLATGRGDVVAVKDVERSVGKVAAGLKTAILAMPSKMAGSMVGLKTKAQAAEVLRGEAETLCRKLIMIGRESAALPEGSDAG